MHVVLITQLFFLREDQNGAAHRQTSASAGSWRLWELRFRDLNHRPLLQLLPAAN